MDKKIILFFTVEFILYSLWLIVIGSLFFVSPLYGDINFIDEGQFGAWANHMLHGKYMYKDIYMSYGPLYVYPLFLLFKLFGPSVFLTRFYLTLGTILGILGIHIISYQLSFKKISRWILLTVVVMLPSMSLRQGVGMLTICVFLYALEKKKIAYFVLTGIMSELCFLISQDIGIMVMVIICIFFILRLFIVNNIVREMQTILSFFLGNLAIVGIFSIWSYREGWFFDYVNTTSDVLFSFSGIDIPNGKNLPNPVQFFWVLPSSFEWIKTIFSKDMLLYWTLLLYCGSLLYLFARMVLKRVDRKDLVILALSLYGCFLYPVVITRPGHLFFILSPLFIILIFFIDKLHAGYPDSPKKYRFINIITIILIYSFFIRLGIIFRFNVNNISLLGNIFHTSEIKRLGPMSISQVQQRYIQSMQLYFKNSPATETVFIFTNEPMLYLLINKVNPTRYDLPFVAHTKQKRYELLEAMIKSPPTYIIEDKNSWAVDEVSNVQRLPEIVLFIKRNYTPFNYKHNTVVFRLNS